MMSHRDRAAFQVRFHPGKNLIWGKNHTGKSSLIKTMFLTMGAKARGKLAKWDEGVVSLVDFQIGEQKFRALHQGGTRALFDEKNNLIIATGDHAIWSEHFASVIGFNLNLAGENGSCFNADPKSFFMPFYINQDGSWQAEWNTFIGVKHFNSPIGPILDYFSGLKPPEYYDAKARRDADQQKLDDLRKESIFLKKAQDRFGERVPFVGAKLDPKNFELEIRKLTSEISDLNSRQEILREKAVRERELLTSINQQISMANEALRSYDKDSKYLRSDSREALICPVCHAEHLDPFLDYFTFAEDARCLKEVVIRLEKDAESIVSRMNTAEAEMRGLTKKYTEISDLLETRKGDLQLRQVVESMGAEHALKAFEGERRSIENEIADLLIRINRFADRMNELTDRDRAKAIIDHFRMAYASALSDLRLPNIEFKQQVLSRRPDLSGSGGPRSVLAYYSAIWSVSYGHYGAFNVPLVVDSPNQQGQDSINLPKVIEFVSTKLPKNAQLILSSETDVVWPFDRKIMLDRPYQMLETESYDEVESMLTPLVDGMYEYLRKNRNLFGEWS